MVINDEAHHCYRGEPAEVKEKMTREEATEAKARAEEARLWITGLEAVLPVPPNHFRPTAGCRRGDRSCRPFRDRLPARVGAEVAGLFAAATSFLFCRRLSARRSAS